MTLTNLTLRDGKTALPGGGIINFGTLALVNCRSPATRPPCAAGASPTKARSPSDRVRCRTTPHPRAAVSTTTTCGSSRPAVRSRATLAAASTTAEGRLELTNTTISDNVGRGLTGNWSNSTLNRVRITGNSGGGIGLHQSRITLTNSTIARNTAPGGAGIFNSAGGVITITKSTLSNNRPAVTAAASSTRRVIPSVASAPGSRS